MARLKKEVRLFITRSLAVFNTPTETVEAVQKEFGITVTRQNCESHDPTKRSGQGLAQEFKDEFEATRKDFLEKPKNIPIANASYRLLLLNTMREAGSNKKNHLLQLKILESARAEMAQLHKIGMEEGDDDDADAIPVKVEVQVKDARKHDRKADNANTECPSS